MFEVELKVETAHGPVRDRLGAAGADPLGTVEQTDVYYDAPDRDFAETDEALRVRVERRVDATAGDTTARDIRLTYKGPLVEQESKTRAEAEVGVDSKDDIESLLAGLGYEPAATVHKERERYELDGCTVTLDVVDGLGEFVEVELETEDNVDRARERAIGVMERLRLDPDEQIRTSYLGLLLAEEGL